MEELKKDVETVKALSQKSFLESVNDLGILKKKATHDEHSSQQSLLNSPSKWRRFAVVCSRLKVNRMEFLASNMLKETPTRGCVPKL